VASCSIDALVPARTPRSKLTWRKIPLEPDGKERSAGVEFRSILNFTDENGAPQVETTCRNVHCRLQVVLRQENVLGRPKEIVSASNPAPLSLAPRITGHAVVASNIQVNFGNEIDLTNMAENFDAIQLSLDGVVYSETPVSPHAETGHWFRSSNAVLFNPHVGVNLTPATPEAHSFRLVINGGETAPYFIERLKVPMPAPPGWLRANRTPDAADLDPSAPKRPSRSRKTVSG